MSILFTQEIIYFTIFQCNRLNTELWEVPGIVFLSEFLWFWFVRQLLSITAIAKDESETRLSEMLIDNLLKY